MEKKLYAKFFQFLDELKNIVTSLDEFPNNKNTSVSDIDIIISELHKSKVERDCDNVKSAMKRLEKVEEIRALISSARNTAEYICYNK